MKFGEWLKSKQGTNNEDVDLVGGAMLEHPSAWHRIPATASPLSVARALYEANDEVAEAMQRVYFLWRSECGEQKEPTPMLDPMSQPYTPGARTTLADARLKLVCAALSTMDRDVPEDAARLSVETADTVLKEMGCRHG